MSQTRIIYDINTLHGVVAAASFILTSGSPDAYELETTSDRYQLEDASGVYLLEAAVSAGNLLRSPSDGSKIERSE